MRESFRRWLKSLQPKGEARPLPTIQSWAMPWSRPRLSPPLGESETNPKIVVETRYCPDSLRFEDNGGNFVPDKEVIAAFNKGGEAWAKLIKSSPRYEAAIPALNRLKDREAYDKKKAKLANKKPRKSPRKKTKKRK